MALQEKFREPLFKLLLLLNILAVFIGLWYYQEQLAATAWQFLLFVPDCPFYVLLAIPILLRLVKNDTFAFLVAVGMAKYGLWTVFVLLLHSGYYFLPALLPTTIIFIIGHLGMALEGMAIIPKKKVCALALALALAWFLFNDYADYSLGARPWIPEDGLARVRDFAIASSIILSLGFYFCANLIRKFPPVKFFRWVVEN